MTKSDVIDAQSAWAVAVVEIGKARGDRKATDSAVDALLNDLYAYGTHEVLFKPTFSGTEPFRLTRDAAKSYFVGGNPDFPQDAGFALRPWSDVRFENVGLIIEDDRAMAMGQYRFTDPKGISVAVEYSFVYIPVGKGPPKIRLHHSSLPVSGRIP